MNEINRSSMAMASLRLALEVRKKNKIDIKDAFCVYDFTEKVGIELKFVDIPSLEGMYISKPQKTILISSHRHSGRQRFTCAHELGHYFFKHGRHIDEIINGSKSPRREPQEVNADLFASFLLMPASTVNNGFIRRGWKIQSATPLQVYTVASWLGVGYITLINHMMYSMKKLSSDKAASLLKHTPKKLKKELLGYYCDENVIPVDPGWTGRPIDLSLGDIIITENEINVDSTGLKVVDSNNGRNIFQAVKTGIGRVFCQQSSWAAFSRISKAQYNGRGKFRHLEDT